MTKVWNTLEDAGTQGLVYADHPRLDIRDMFSFPPKRILDIGCATGAVSGSIKADFPEVFAWGCELNPMNAEIAKTRLDKVTQKITDDWTDEEIDLLKQTDTVLLLDVLEHIYNPWSVLQFLHKHLPKNAQIIVSLPNVGNYNVLQGLAYGNWQYQHTGILDITHLRFFTEYEMKKMLYETGYAVTAQSMNCYPNPLPEKLSSFPVWFGTDKLKIRVDNQTEWDNLNAVQIYYCARVTADEQLSEDERELRFGNHR